jgi:hypothetical protein
MWLNDMEVNDKPKFFTDNPLNVTMHFVWWTMKQMKSWLYL